MQHLYRAVLHHAIILMPDPMPDAFCRSTLPPGPDAGDPPALRGQVMQLFEAFVRLLDEAPAERQHTQFVIQLRELDLLKVCDLPWPIPT